MVFRGASYGVDEMDSYEDVGKMNTSTCIASTCNADTDAHSSQKCGAAETRARMRASYARSLEMSLLQLKDMMLDFTSLKACLDPLSESTVENEDGESEQFDYEGFLYEWFETGEKFPPLESLVVRNLKLSADGPKIDNYAYFCHGLMQLNTLVELDLSGNLIPGNLQSHLQLWNLYNVKKLNMDGTGLTKFPPSVGRLRKLEVLSLSKNKLNDLPITLGFCKELRVLNLQKNSFTRIPGVVLHLEKLEDLRRLDNPLSPRWSGFSSHPHVNKHNRAPAKPKQPAVYNPESLQMLCTKVVFTHKIDYWKRDTLGPMQCKTLDNLAADVTICENCHTTVPKQGYTVEVLLLSFLDLKDVPFVMHACSEECQKVVYEKYTSLQTQLQQKLDKDYEETVRQALAHEGAVDISPKRINAPEGQIATYVPTYRYRASRRRKKCAVM